MDAEAFVAAAAVLVRWRVAVCAVGGFVAAFVLSRLAWVSLPQLLGVVLAAGLIGVAWDGRAVPTARSPLPVRRTQPSTLLLSIGLAAAGWGALSAASWGSVLIGGAVACAAICAWALRRVPGATPQVQVVAGCALLGYVVGVALSRNAL